MKKMWKSKFEEAWNLKSKQSPSSEQVTPPMQPPLPLDPPPPHSPIIIKKEKEDHDYGTHSYLISNITSVDDSLTSEDSMSPNFVSDQHLKKSKPTPQMCIRFVREICMRGVFCKYEHKIYLDQLKGIFKFCWNYQKEKCHRKLCYYVHATVFEEQQFYRTGRLPLNVVNPYKVRATLKKAIKTKIEPQAALLPPLQPSTDAVAIIPPKFNYPPPQYPAQTQPLVSGFNKDHELKLTPNNVPAKRTHFQANVSSSPPDHQASEPLAKKCKKCDVNEYRLNLCTYQRTEMLQAAADLKKTIARLDRNGNELYSILSGVFNYCGGDHNIIVIKSYYWHSRVQSDVTALYKN